MTIEGQPLDISALPDLARLVDEVRATGTPRLLRRGNEDVAVLMPAPASPRRRPTPDLPPHPTQGIAHRTAGALRQYRRIPPATPAEEKEAVAQAIAEQVATSMDD